MLSMNHELKFEIYVIYCQNDRDLSCQLFIRIKKKKSFFFILRDIGTKYYHKT
jgi:hypothetical protein